MKARVLMSKLYAKFNKENNWHMDTIKQILLDLDLVIDNEYLSKYLELMENNINTQKMAGATQRHHLIPISAYKHIHKISTREETETKNFKNFCVNLLYSDHLLAHYYLCLCSKTSAMLYSNFKAIQFIFQNKCVEKDLRAELEAMYKNFIANLPRYQEMYAITAQIQAQKSRETILKNKNIHSEETRAKIRETREKNKLTKVTTVRIHKDNVEKVIPKSLLTAYENAGWKRGRSQQHKTNIQPYYKSKKGKHFSPATEFKKGDPKLRIGRKPSDETRLKMSLAKKGKPGHRLGAKLTLEQRQRLSDAHKGLESTKRKIILQFDLEGNFIKEWPSISKATEVLHINNIIAVCKGKTKHAGGFIWKYKKEEK